MYSSEIYNAHYYPRYTGDLPPIYDFEPHHEIWNQHNMIREHELVELSLINHELDNMELHNHNLQLERERAMALNDRHMIGIDPIHEVIEPYGTGYGPIHGGFYPGPEIMHSHHYNPLATPLVNDPVYHHTTFDPPRVVPTMDPYFINTMMPGIMPGSGPAYIPPPIVRNPFSYGIDHDYGHGAIAPLSSYGLVPGGLQPGYGRILDDLYLYEMMLRLDQTLDEKERLLRWQERLAFEELSQMERQLRWQQMDLMERSRLGLGAGSYWGYEFGRLPIDPTFGYLNPALGCEVLEYYQPLGRAPIMGVVGQPHYPISHTLLSQYPMWNVGGLGLGARVSSWLDGLFDDMLPLRPKDIIRRENMLRDYAERRGEIPAGFRLLEPGRAAYI